MKRSFLLGGLFLAQLAPSRHAAWTLQSGNRKRWESWTEARQHELGQNGSFETVGAAGPLTTWSASGGSQAAAGQLNILVDPVWRGGAELGTFLGGSQWRQDPARQGGSLKSNGVVQVMGPWAPPCRAAWPRAGVSSWARWARVGDGGNAGISCRVPRPVAGRPWWFPTTARQLTRSSSTPRPGAPTSIDNLGVRRTPNLVNQRLLRPSALKRTSDHVERNGSHAARSRPVDGRSVWAGDSGVRLMIPLRRPTAVTQNPEGHDQIHTDGGLCR